MREDTAIEAAGADLGWIRWLRRQRRPEGNRQVPAHTPQPRTLPSMLAMLQLHSVAP